MPRRRLPLTGHHTPPGYRLFYGDFAAQPYTRRASDPAVQLTEALTVLRWHAGNVLSSAVCGPSLASYNEVYGASIGSGLVKSGRNQSSEFAKSDRVLISAERITRRMGRSGMDTAKMRSHQPIN